MAKAVQEFADVAYLVPDNPRFEDINKINNDVISGFSKDMFQVFDNRKWIVSCTGELRFQRYLNYFWKK